MPEIGQALAGYQCRVSGIAFLCFGLSVFAFVRLWLAPQFLLGCGRNSYVPLPPLAPLPPRPPLLPHHVSSPARATPRIRLLPDTTRSRSFQAAPASCYTLPMCQHSSNRAQAIPGRSEKRKPEGALAPQSPLGCGRKSNASSNSFTSYASPTSFASSVPLLLPQPVSSATRTSSPQNQKLRNEATMSLINKASSFFRPIRHGSKGGHVNSCGDLVLRAAVSGTGTPAGALPLTTKARSDSHGVLPGPRAWGRPLASLFFERPRSLTSSQFIFNGLRAADYFISPRSLHWLRSCNSLVRRAASAVGAGYREAVMSGFIGFAEVVGAIIAAIGLSMGLEWIALNGLLRLMPVHHDARGAGSVQELQRLKPQGFAGALRRG